MEVLNRDCSLSSQLTRLSTQLGHPIGRSCLDESACLSGRAEVGAWTFVRTEYFYLPGQSRRGTHFCDAKRR